jgi:MSHA biogenesis protein MshM
LLGQPELDAKLARPEIRQLMQRITFSSYLGPMAAERVPVYLTHRLGTAAIDANTDVQIFEPAAAQTIARFSNGVPRLINVLAHKCLMLAYGENVHRVSAVHVKFAATDTPGVVLPLPWWKRLWRKPPVAPQPLWMETDWRKPSRSKS